MTVIGKFKTCVLEGNSPQRILFVTHFLGKIFDLCRKFPSKVRPFFQNLWLILALFNIPIRDVSKVKIDGTLRKSWWFRNYSLAISVMWVKICFLRKRHTFLCGCFVHHHFSDFFQGNWNVWWKNIVATALEIWDSTIVDFKKGFDCGAKLLYNAKYCIRRLVSTYAWL